MSGGDTPIQPAVWVDWKEESGEVLFQLREACQERCPALADSRFDALAENYAAEDTLDFLQALGQELTCWGWSLWYTAEEADAYPLVLLPLEEGAPGPALGRRSRARQLRQSRRKIGQSARLLDLGRRLPCERYVPPLRPRLGQETLLGECLWLENLPGEDPPGGRLRLETWPPRMEPCSCTVLDAAGEDGRFAAILARYRSGGRGAEPGFPRLWTGRALEELTGSAPPEGRPLERDILRLSWFHEELFLLGSSRVCRCPAGGGEVREELRIPERVADFPTLFTLGDTLYLYLGGGLYRWREGGVLRGAGFSRLRWRIAGETARGFLPVGDREVAFLSRSLSVSWEDMARWSFTVLDVETGRTRQVPCRFGELRLWQGRICVLPYRPRRGEPILQCFDLAAGERWELPYGALGKSEIYDIFTLRDGRTLLCGDGLYRVDTEELWSFLKGAGKETIL